MSKLIVLALVGSVLCKWLTGRWPWQHWAASEASLRQRQAETRARGLLGVPPGASHGDVIAAHKRLLAQVHPDRGGTADLVHEANAARDLLLAGLSDRSKP